MVAPIGEGMLRPTDSIRQGGEECPNPFLTAWRALKDELSLDNRVHFNQANTRLIALYFDFGRYQPIALFAVSLRISSTELLSLWRTAKDSHEHTEMVFVKNDPYEIRKMLDGKAEWHGHPVTLASNHARMSLFVSMLYYHQYEHVRNAFASGNI